MFFNMILQLFYGTTDINIDIRSEYETIDLCNMQYFNGCSFRGYDLLDDLYRITCPVLVIGSEDDHVVGAEASVQIAEHLSDQTECEIYMYDGYGHAAYDLAPDYKERLPGFLRP